MALTTTDTVNVIDEFKFDLVERSDATTIDDALACFCSCVGCDCGVVPPVPPLVIAS
ncbi:MAG TPA: hypothetical protein VF230_19290 [Acidimicrobiales bacterium]